MVSKSTELIQNSFKVESKSTCRKLIDVNISQRKAKRNTVLSILCEIWLLLHTTSVNKVKKYICKSIFFRQTLGYNLFDGFPIRTSIVTRKFYRDLRKRLPILRTKGLKIKAKCNMYTLNKYIIYGVESPIEWEKCHFVSTTFWFRK